MKAKYIVLLGLILLMAQVISAQQHPAFTHQDTLRGSITPERAWWDLTYYHLNVKVDPTDSSFSGSNLIQYRVLERKQVMQIDLQPPMTIKKIIQNGEEQSYVRDGNAWFVTLKTPQEKGKMMQLNVEFGGKPKVSHRPPWDGGVSWKKDEKGRDFIATACQGDGASLWWPCKDHPYDEPDSMLISVTFPDDLMDVSNGRLRKVTDNGNGTKTADWFVNNPINSYGVNVNLAHYVHFGETFKGEKGDLDCNYWVVDYNLEKAKAHFKQAPMMLKVFEHWYGPYPFYEDGYKLVEVSYPGMEHQSSVTYGNGFKNGYGGRDVSSSGYGMKFDFILVHESGHEWFANNITNSDEADMWIHESFTNYAENLFVEYYWGKEAGSEYVRGSRLNIRNDRPIIGIYNVNYPGSGDMYYKGGNMLHTIRQIVNDDEKWRQILRGLNKTFYHQTVNATQIEDYMSHESGIDLKPVFDQYLRDIGIPDLEYAVVDNQLRYRWGNCVSNFNMKVKVYINEEMQWIEPNRRWKSMDMEQKFQSFSVDKDFYLGILPVVVFE